MKKVFRNLLKTMKYEFERADDFEVCLWGIMLFALAICILIIFYMILCCLIHTPWIVLLIGGLLGVGCWFGFFVKNKLKNMEIP